MTTVTQLVRGTESIRSRAEAANGTTTINQSRYAAGTKTLMISGEVASSGKKSSRYSVVMVFQNVGHEAKKGGRYRIPFTVDGDRLFVETPRASTHDVRVRCSCSDFTHTWAWWNNKKDALFGAKYPPYSRKTADAPERNKTHEAGLCKHLLAVVQKLRDVRVLIN